MTIDTTSKSNQSNTLVEPIQAARRHLGELSAQLAGIDKRLPGRSASINALLEKAYAELRKADQGLTNPVFSIATVGTTSSGKSTLLNGVLGRRLAPMDADEMSAGLLNIVHSDSWGLSVQHQGATALHSVDSEEAIYNVLTRHMSEQIRARHQGSEKGSASRKSQTMFHVSGPLFPLIEAHDFRRAVGSHVGFGVYDLPGLRTVDDPENLNVIKNQIRRAFSLVVIDRTKIFSREERDALLDELQETVRDLGGRTSMMIFVLNKVDTRTVNDSLTIEEEAKKAGQEIATRLGLSTPVEVVPFSGLLYYHAARLNYALIAGHLEQAQAIRGPLLKDCSQSLLAYMKLTHTKDDYRQHREIINRIEDESTEGHDSPIDALRLLAKSGLMASGHQALWASIVQRIEQHLPEIIIYPQVNEGIKSSSKLCRELQGYIQTQLIETDEGLDQALQEIEAFGVHIEHFTGKQREHYRGLIADVVQLIRESGGTTDNAQQIRDNLNKLGVTRERHPELYDIDLTIDKLTGDLEREVLNLIEDRLLSPVLSSTVRKDFQSMVGEECADALANAYERLKDAGYRKEEAENGEKFKKKNPNNEQKQRYKDIQRATAELFFAIRGAMTRRAERYLSSLGSVIARQVSELTQDLGAKASQEIRGELIGDFHSVFAERMSVNRIDMAVIDENIQLPMEVIRIPEPDFSTVTTKNEVVGKRHDDPNASCFKGQLREVKGDVEYLEVSVPSAQEITIQLLEGLHHARDGFWERFFSWFEEQCFQALDRLSLELRDYLDMVRDGLTHRRQCLEDEAQSQIENWKKIESELGELDALVCELSRDAGVNQG